MSEEIENQGEGSKTGEMFCASTTEDSPGSKLLRNLRGRNDQSGDWKIDEEPFYFHPILSKSPQNDLNEIGNPGPENLAEWKYKNVYSVAVPNEDVAACWSPRRFSTGDDRSSRSMELVGVVANYRPENPDAKDEMESDDMMSSLREYLAAYQESNGTPRDEYTFVSLMKAMGQATCHALMALFYIFVNVSPLIQLFLFILRFVLDKLLSIRKMGYAQQPMMKYAIFGGQLTCIYVCLVFIFGFIVFPIFNLVLAILAKIFLFK